MGIPIEVKKMKPGEGNWLVNSEAITAPLNVLLVISSIIAEIRLITIILLSFGN